MVSKKTRRRIKSSAKKGLKRARRTVKTARKAAAKRGKKQLSKALKEWNRFRKFLVKEYGIKSMKAASRIWKQFKKDNEKYFKSYGKYPKMTKAAGKKIIKRLRIKV